MPSLSAPSAIWHVCITVPRARGISRAVEFYGDVIQMRMIPEGTKEDRLWFELGESKQELHIAAEKVGILPLRPPYSFRHICLAIPSYEGMVELHQRIWQHMQTGSKAAAIECTPAGEIERGPHGHWMFFCRDFAGNWIEVAAVNP